MNLYKKLNAIIFITLLNIFVSASILLGPTLAQDGLLPTGARVELEFTWLSVANFQKMSDNTQRAIVATTRDAVVFTLHTDNQHELDECVRAFPNEELEAIKNSMAAMPPGNQQYSESVVAVVGKLLVGLCALTLDQQATPQTLPNPSL